MRKRILYFVSVVCMLFVTYAAQAKVIQTYDYDPTGTWYLRLDYNTETTEKQVYLVYYSGSTSVEELVFPTEIHAIFENYNGLHEDLGGDFRWQFDEHFSLDPIMFAPYLKRIVFSEGINKICDDFYSCNRDLTMGGLPEEWSVLEEVIFKDGGDKVIGARAFSGHPKLKKVEFAPLLLLSFPKVSIGECAFAAPYETEYDMYGGGLQTFVSALEDIPVFGVIYTAIGERAFEGCTALKGSFYLSEQLTALGDYAFASAGLEEVGIDGNCMFSMNDNAYPFSGCPIERVFVNPSNSVDGLSATIPAHLFKGVNSMFDVEIRTFDAKAWQHLVFGEQCFYGSSITSISLPETFVPDPAFPSLEFGEKSFANTYYFKQELDLRQQGTPNGVQIHNNAFENSAIQGVHFGTNVEKIGEAAFANTQLSGTLTIPQYHNPWTNADEDMVIGDRAFYNTKKLGKVELLTTVKNGRLNESVFNNCGATEYSLNNALKTIGYMAFSGSKIEKFTGWKALEEIGQDAFSFCDNLTSVDLSATQVEELAIGLFASDAKLTEIRFPERDIVRVKENAFGGTGFTSLDIYATSLEADAFNSMPNLERVRLTHPKMNTLTGGAFRNLPKLKELDFGYVQHITGDVMSNCEAFDSLVITAAIEDIDKDAFLSVYRTIDKVNFKSTRFKAVADPYSAPFVYFESELYIDETVKSVPKNAFAGMHITNSPELHKDLVLTEGVFKEAVIDSLNWHYQDRSYEPFKDARIEKLAFSGIKTIKNGLFANTYIGNLYLEGVETIGENAFENSDIPNPVRKSCLIIPGSVKEIQSNAFKNVDGSESLVFEKGDGLTIRQKAFSLPAGVIFHDIYAYYDAAHIPAAADAFDFVEKVTNFYAGSCSDIDAYKAAAGWKEIPVANWNGVSQYKWSFAVEGIENEYPADFFESYIFVNELPLQYATVACDNKLSVEFMEPCSDISFVKWPDNTTNKMAYTATLTSDTVIRITVAEHREKLQIALQDASLADIAKLYIRSEGGDWEEKTEAMMNGCKSADIKVELLDKTHYYFDGWYNGTSDDAKQMAHTEEYHSVYDGVSVTWYARIKSYPIYVSLDIEPGCIDCWDMIDHFEINGENKGLYAGESFGYNDEVSIKFVGKEISGTRYVLDYWQDDMGNYVTDQNPYVFRVVDAAGYQFRPVIKTANKYTVTAKSNDNTLGTVTMVPEAGAETSKGSGVFWEGSHIELQAVPAGEHIHVAKWSDNPAGKENTQNNRTITVRRNYEYVATFEKDSFNVVIKPNDIAANPALVSYTGAGRYAWGDDVTVTCTILDEHYEFDSWTIGEDGSFKTATATFEKVGRTADFEITLSVQPKEYTVTTVATPADGGTVTGGGKAAYQASLALTATPNEGYEFVEWAEDHETNAERNVTVTGDATYTAVFAKRVNLTPQNLIVTRVAIDGDERITLSWDKVEGVPSYELQFKNGETVLATSNTFGQSSVSRLLSELKTEYKLIAPGTYTIGWAVRSTDLMGNPVSDWANGEALLITIEGTGTGLGDVPGDDVQSAKMLINGTMYILRGGKTYDATGRLVE